MILDRNITDMVGLTHPQIITSSHINKALCLSQRKGLEEVSLWKSWKQSQDCPLMANEKNDFILNWDFIGGFAHVNTVF